MRNRLLQRACRDDQRRNGEAGFQHTNDRRCIVVINVAAFVAGAKAGQKRDSFAFCGGEKRNCPGLAPGLAQLVIREETNS
jgi:hypothetical protein